MYIICPSRRYELISLTVTRRLSASSHNGRTYARKIAKIKIHEGIPVHDERRTADVLESVFELAVEYKIDPVAVQKIFEILITMSEDRQRDFSGEGNLP